MQVTVEHTSSIEKRLKIQVPAEEVNDKVDSKLRELGKQVRLKGFRPGRIPFKVLRQRYGTQATQEVIQQTTQTTLQEAIQQESLRIAAMPRLEQDPVLDKTTGLEINAIIEVYPDLDVIEVKDIVIERPDASVTEADIDEMLETLRQQRIEWTDLDSKPAEGNQVLLEYSAETDDGTVPEEGKLRLAIIIGESGFDALEKALMKLAPGDEKSLKLEFPEDFREAALAGKKAKVDLTVSKVQQGELPEVDEDFAKSFGIESGDLDELRTEVRGNLERELKQAVATQIKTQLVDSLLEAHSDMEVPESLVINEAHSMVQRMLRGAEMEVTREMLEPFMEQARKRVRSGLLLGELARQNEIRADGAKVRETIEEIAQTYEQPAEVVQMYYNDQRLLDAVENQVLENQVVDWAVNNAKVTDKAMSFQDVINTATKSAGKSS